jgi:low affinity Fe/Cu permease
MSSKLVSPKVAAADGGWHPKEMFSRFARATAVAAGKPIVFLTAVAVVLVWAATGPMFHYSDTWQLVINTGTTIVTFLMVFLIQNTQNRDTMAVQLKLGELILAMRGAENRLATAEEMTDEELEAMHEHCRKRADQALESLTARRAAQAAKHPHKHADKSRAEKPKSSERAKTAAE